MTANTFFNAISYPGIALPGKTEPIKELSELIIIHKIYNLSEKNNDYFFSYHRNMAKIKRYRLDKKLSFLHNAAILSESKQGVKYG